MSNESMKEPEVEFLEDTLSIVEKDLTESAKPPEDQSAERDLQSSSDSCCTGSTASIQDADDAIASGSNVLKGTKKGSCVSPRMDAITSDVQASPANNMDEPLLNDQDLTTDNLPEQPVIVCCRCIQMRRTFVAKIRNSRIFYDYHEDCKYPFNIALFLRAKGALGFVIIGIYIFIVSYSLGKSPSGCSCLKCSTLIMIALLRLLMILEEFLVFPYAEKSGDCLFLYNFSVNMNAATLGVLFLVAILHYDILIHKCVVGNSGVLERETEV
ncbi:hypothetical protein NPIL_100302 [Nephila pilipes]|uniref:Uncharacterized protein n=1 Tax=Nephila pilipes TaxID=299642 RepID=A0A8X6MPD5_NEPPI|nr:hypothetical protein NPIL_100302 [Nephila pilipes]